MDPERFTLSLTVDDEGVVRVDMCSHEKVTVTPDELARLLTGLVKAICGDSDEDQSVDVNLN